MNNRPRLTWHNCALADTMRRAPDSGATLDWLFDDSDGLRLRSLIQNALNRLTAAGIVLKDGDRYRFPDRFTEDQRDWLRQAQAKVNAETGGFDSTFHQWEAEQDAKEAA